ncbi:2-oxoglutarate dehydrogenase, E2 component, dihydrolipoamide succinyltransferase [Kocuria marina]|uniref:2-oxoglutarate dehydrogenase, E2 component, dihydrolipoamide succinyltransferase n=2 Tax=Kocuria marina TaxID=223184 RepID=UPI0022E4E3C7|nr:2-oxoglutarate dehydrogenase, E2 component, dihydrolipoamide succinyltransferase [Kocuria marina]
MSETVNLPALGESVTEGTVTRWLKQVGDEVAVDEPLLEVSTDKVDTEVPSPVAGVVEKILVEEDEDVEVGAPLVVIGDGSGSGSDDSSDASAEEVEDAATEADSGENTEQAAETETEQAPKADTKQSSGNSVEVTLPALGESVTEGTVTRWLKEVGEQIEVDEPLLEVSTDKVDTEVPSPVAGTLLEIKVQEDEDAEVGQVLAIVGDESAAGSGDSGSDNGSSDESGETEAEQVEDAATEAEQVEDAATEADSGENTEQAAEAKAPQKSSGSEEKSAPAKQSEPAASSDSGAKSSDSGAKDVPGYVTPLVRKLAREKGVDLSTITGTGVGGRIRKQDVLAAAEEAAKQSEAPQVQDTGANMAPAVSRQGSEAQPASAPAPDAKRGTTEKAPRIRMTIAKRMRESLDVSAQLTQVTEVDMTRVAQLRQKAKDQFQKREGAKLTFMPFFAKAVAEALQAHPVLNATFKEESKEIVYNASEDIAIAVDTPRGLLVPVVKNAGDLNLGGLAKQIAEVGAAAKDGSISPDQLTGGTFTITNIGSFGALFDTPIINQPQVAILGTGTIVKRPMVLTDADGNDTIAIRHMCYLSLTYDHRLVDGADAGRFLGTLKKRLEAGQFESEVGL